MSLYTSEQIKEILKNPKVEEEKSSALVSQKHHKLHVTGKGYKDWWLGSQAQGYESKETHKKKKTICTPTTPRITEAIKKQFFKIFRAKGFVFDYKFKNDSKEKKKEFLEIVQEAMDGLTPEQFMQNIWFSASFEDFNGFIGIELKPVEELEDPEKPEPQVCFYPLESIYDVCIEGSHIEYIVIKTRIIVRGKEVDGYRFIDEYQDVIYIKENNEFTINTKTDETTGNIYEDRIENPFKLVPFIQVSNIRATVYSDFLKNSPLTKVLPNLDTYLSVSDDHQVCVKRHQHPIFYSYPITCPTCNGVKTTRVPLKMESGIVDYSEEMCGTCNGVGSVSHLKGDVLQGITLPVVESYEENGFPAAQAPAGYVVNDHESIREQRVELADQERFIEKGALGVEGILTRDTVAAETATKAELDLQPLMDTLSSFSANAEQIHSFIINTIGKVVYGDEFEGAYIHYGRKYFLKTEKSIIAEYEEAKTGGANESFLKELLEELYHTRFENNPSALMRSLMLLDIEPLPTRNNIDELVKIKEFTLPEILVAKVNFNDLIERFERENGAITFYKPEADYSKRVQEIQTKIIEYAKEYKISFTPQNTGGQGGSQNQAFT